MTFSFLCHYYQNLLVRKKSRFKKLLTFMLKQFLKSELAFVTFFAHITQVGDIWVYEINGLTRILYTFYKISKYLLYYYSFFFRDCRRGKCIISAIVEKFKKRHIIFVVKFTSSQKLIRLIRKIKYRNILNT